LEIGSRRFFRFFLDIVVDVVVVVNADVDVDVDVDILGLVFVIIK